MDNFVSNIIHAPTFLLIFKLGGLIILGFYLLFLLVILKQIRSMNTIITQPDLFPILQTALFLLIGFTVVIFILGVVVL